MGKGGGGFAVRLHRLSECTELAAGHQSRTRRNVRNCGIDMTLLKRLHVLGQHVLCFRLFMPAGSLKKAVTFTKKGLSSVCASTRVQRPAGRKTAVQKLTESQNV